MSTAFSLVSAPAAGNRASDVFKSESGAFDLPSIIVGVVVVGILTAGVLASIFGIIPFAQDKGAQQDLGSVVTAQGVYLAASTEKYGEETNTYAENLGELAKSGTDLIGDEVASDASILMEGTVGDFYAVTESGSGTFWGVSSKDSTPVDLGDDLADLDAALAKLQTAPAAPAGGGTVTP